MRSVSLYVALGLPHDATEEDIQRAYEILLQKYSEEAQHNRGSKKKIEEVKKAYNVLGDAKKREIYDAHGTVGVTAKMRAAFSAEAIDQQNTLIQALWAFCFTATCCCFCYCCCFCCGQSLCRCNTHVDEDEEEMYIRKNFSKYIPEDSCLSCISRRHRKMRVRSAARKRRKDDPKRVIAEQPHAAKIDSDEESFDQDTVETSNKTSNVQNGGPPNGMTDRDGSRDSEVPENRGNEGGEQSPVLNNCIINPSFDDNDPTAATISCSDVELPTSTESETGLDSSNDQELCNDKGSNDVARHHDVETTVLADGNGDENTEDITSLCPVTSVNIEDNVYYNEVTCETKF